MKKKLLVILFSVFTVFVLASNNVFADEHNHTDWTVWGDEGTLPKTAGNYFLTCDVTLSETWEVPNGTTNLCLNGHVIKANVTDQNKFSVITIPSESELNLYDCDTATVHNGYVDENGLWHLDATNEHNGLVDEKDITGGVITGGTAEHGGGVYVDSGTFNMYGGSITDNKAQYGGGVDNNGTFKMYGGEITNNYAEQLGGGINLNGIFNMYDGEITGNKTGNAKNGAGVYVNSGTFTMFGGKIADNNVPGNNGTPGGGYGAGVYVNTQAAFAMKGDSVISGNIGGQGAGVYTKGTFTMSGNSEVTNNTGTYGAGVGVYDGASFTMSESSKITNNIGTNGGGLCVNNNGLFQMFGSSTINNNISSGYGAGVYANGSVTLGGEAKITGNIKGEIKYGVLVGDPQNVFLPNNKYITLGTNLYPTGNFKIGVTTQTAPTDGVPVKITTNGTLTDTGYFASDDTDYEVKYNASGYLELAVKTIPSTTIADILPDDFPTSYETAWITEQGLYTCCLDSSNLRFNIDGGGYIAATTATVTPSGDDYVYTYEDGSVTFNMENGELTSITVMVNDDDKTYVYALRFGVTVNGGNYVEWYLIDKGTAYSVSGNTLTVGDKTDTAGAIEGKEFDCWKIGETPVTEDGTITEDTTFVATYKAVHTHAPVLVNGQAATESAAGWKDYYECACGALFEDENGTTPIENLATWKAEGGNGYIAPLAPSIDYEIISGNNANINIDNNKDALFTSDADYSKFERVEIDGTTVDHSNYTVESGSTKVILKASYLNTLSVGQHTIDIISTDGHASTTFTITKNNPSPNPRYDIPNTGVDGVNNHSLLKLSSLSLLAIGTYIVIKKKKDN